ncbi:MAG: phenylacetic acid degradation protein PaaY [Arcobacter sp.]|nr:MAG: phenylacetic acid degradation protein PaaY [Arcobacter sp.]
MQIYEIDGLIPVISEKAFVHETAVIIGDVFIEEGVYIGPNASIRGDFGRIIIKKNANIQDCCVCHSFPNIDVIVEEYGHIGHSAILHGCHVKFNAMVGMGSVIMDEAVIGENSIIGASSLVPSKTVIPDNHLAFGNPAKVRRELKKEEISWKKAGTVEYTNLAYNCLENLKKCKPLNQTNEQRDSLRCEMNFKPKYS